MALNSALGMSGVSIAVGIMNSRGLNTLSLEVEELKKSMIPTEVVEEDTAEEIGNDYINKISLLQSQVKTLLDKTQITTIESNINAMSDTQLSIKERLNTLEIPKETNNFSEDIDQLDSRISTSVGMIEDVESDLSSSIQRLELNANMNKSTLENTSSVINKIEQSSLEDSVLISGMDARITTMKEEFTRLEQSSKDSSALVAELDTEIDETFRSLDTIITLTPDIQNLLVNWKTSDIENWKTFNTNAKVTTDGNFQAEKCNLGLDYGKGDSSAIKFSGLVNNKWCMYGSSPTGKGPDGLAPQEHGNVTGDAIRVRIGKEKNNGFIVENSDRQGLFSVNGTGFSTLGSMKMGDITPGLPGIAHANFHTSESCAFRQSNAGVTTIGSAKSKDIVFKVDGMDKVIIDGSTTETMKLFNSDGTHPTYFNYKGNNYIRSGDGQGTFFRSGTSGTSILTVGNTGVKVLGSLTVDNVSLNGVPGKVTSLETKVAALEKRINTLESNSSNYVKFTDQVLIYNHVAKKYLNSNGNVDQVKTSIHAHYQIQKD